MAYQEQLQQPEWAQRRVAILNRADYRCERCGKTDTLFHIHHKKYITGLMAWEYPDELLECLCELCHEIEHAPSCCDSQYYQLSYNREIREKILIPIDPLYCPVCGTPRIEGRD